jgi:NADH:ubiquinone oxidoreductase subunit 6 (subunit J)
MAYAAPPDAPRARPGTVNLAVILLYVAAALEVVNAIVAFANYNAYKEGYEKAYANTSIANQAGTAAVTVIVSGVIALVLAVIFLVLAILDGKGNRVGRILTWVFGGIALCCLGSAFGLSSFAKSNYENTREHNQDLPPYDQLQHDINSSLPSWYTPVTTILGIVVLLAIIVTIILLALPASNAYFRKRDEPQWEPPTTPPYPPTA